MQQFEYKVVPAPTRGTKAKGVKTGEARFALSLQEVMNREAADGWSYLRAETLPSTERSGLTGSTTEWRNMLVFQRALPVEDTVAVDMNTAPEPAEMTAEVLAATLAPVAVETDEETDADNVAQLPDRKAQAAADD